MGFLSSIGKSVKKAVGKVFKPIVKGLDKITGGYFSKIMGNKWVQGALMAVAVVTGGIAIVNGVMAAGQAGIGTAAKAFAANMSMETGGALVNAVVEGGKQFISGVASGLADPLGSEAGQAATGMFDSAVGSITGTPVTGTDQLAEAANAGASASETASAAALDAGSAAPPVAIPNATPPSTGTLVPSASSVPGNLPVPGMPAAAAVSPSGSAVPAATDPSLWAGTDANLMNSATAGPPVMETDILSKLASGAKELGGKAVDYATSTPGMYQIGTSLQGWAQGQALQERWDALEEQEKERYRSWTDGSFKMPRFNPQPG